MCGYREKKKSDNRAGGKRNTKAEARQCIEHEAEPLPTDFYEWLDSKVFNDTYMYYAKTADGYLGYCSCGTDDIPLDKPRSGKYTNCPICGKKVRLKQDIYSSYTDERKIAAYVQATSRGWMQRLYVCYKITDYNAARTPRVKVRFSIDEDQRDHLSTGGDYWKFHPNPNYGKLMPNPPKAWLDDRGKIHGMGYSGWTCESSYMKIYPYNLQALFADSEYKYSMIWDFATHTNVINPFRYLYKFLHYPQLEYLIKLRLYALAGDVYAAAGDRWEGEVRRVKPEGKTLEQIAGIKSRKDIDFCAAYNLDGRATAAYLKTRQWKAAPADMFCAINFMTVMSQRGFKFDFISNERLYAYYLTQKSKYTVANFLCDYSDYIRAVRFLKMNTDDTKVKTPRDFKYCHDVAIARQNEIIEARRKKEEKKRQQSNRRAYKKLFAEYNKTFAASDKKYKIVVPASPDEIVREGEVQGHCVKMYVDRVAAGTTIILFLRKTTKPDEAFCTVEVSPKDYRIIQNRTKGNADAPPAAKSWLERQMKKIRVKAKKPTQAA